MLEGLAPLAHYGGGRPGSVMLQERVIRRFPRTAGHGLDLPLTEQAALGFASQTKRLAEPLKRYERRALSLPKRWLEDMPRR